MGGGVTVAQSGASYDPTMRNGSLAANMLAAYQFPVTCMVVCPVDGKVIVAMEINQFLQSGQDYTSFLRDPAVIEGGAECFGAHDDDDSGIMALPY